MDCAMNVDILDPQLLIKFQQVEILEHVLKQLDNKSLLKVRSVSKNWNHEINKILVKRRYGKIITDHTDIYQVQEICRSLKIGGFISPRILIGNLIFWVGHWDPEYISDPPFKIIINNYGSLIHHLHLFCDYAHLQLQGINGNIRNVIDVLNKCPNIETLIFFFAFNDCANLPTYNPFSINEHKKLNMLHLCSYHEELLDSPWDPLTDSDKTFRQQIKFYRELFQQLIMSTQQLKYLSFDAKSEIIDILEILTEEKSGVPGKLRCIQHLNLQHYVGNQKAFYKLLQIISNSVETLLFSNFVYDNHFSLKFYFKMEKLTTIFIENPLETVKSIELRTESLPSLNTLVIGEYKSVGYNYIHVGGSYKYDWNFKWPFCPTLGGWKPKSQWQESIKGLIIGKPKEGDSSTPVSQLNVVIYSERLTYASECVHEIDCHDYESSWVESLFNKIPIASVGSLFINLGHSECKTSFENWKKSFLANLAKIPYLKHCLIHDDRGAGGKNPHPKTYQFVRKDWDFVEMAE